MQPPIQQPGPPILIGGAGPRTMSLTAFAADAINFGSTWDAETPEKVAAKLAVLHAACAEIGRPPETLLPTFLGLLALAETEDALERKMGEIMRPEDRERLTASGWLVTGTPEQVAAYYRARADVGMRMFIASLAETDDHESIRLLASAVAPLVNADQRA
jgi:alkanesulfonate monooxygenase